MRTVLRVQELPIANCTIGVSSWVEIMANTDRVEDAMVVVGDAHAQAHINNVCSSDATC